MQVWNPTAKRVLKNTTRLHLRLTQNNTSRGLTSIRRVHPNARSPAHDGHCTSTHQRLQWTQPKATIPPTTRPALPPQATQRIVMQQAINVLTIKEKGIFDAMFTPRDLMQHTVIPFTHLFEHYANPMVHPVTGENIQLYKVDAQSRDWGNLANCVWKRLWGDGTRWQQNGPKRCKWFVCHDTRRNTTSVASW